MDNAELFKATLSLAVLMDIERMKEHPRIRENVLGAQEEMGRALGTFGDAVMFKDKNTPASFGVLAQCVAALAFQPGGVTVAGLHFEARQEGA